MRRLCTLFVVVTVFAALGSIVAAEEPAGVPAGEDYGLAVDTGDFFLSLAGLYGSPHAREERAPNSSVKVLPTALSLNAVSALVPLALGAAEDGEDVPAEAPADAPADAPANDSGKDHRTYLSLKAGPQWYLGDADDLDVGIYSELALGFELLPILALEVASGYFWGEGDEDVVDAEVWGVPLLVQAKVTLPIWILHLYGGLGVGGYYVDSDVDIGPLSDDESDWVFGGNVFLGALMSFDRLFLGLEAKYTITDDADVAFDETVNLEGIAAMAVLGFRF